MRIIGHRGAVTFALENTLTSIQKAKDLGVDAVEFDIRLTADRHLVLSHDRDLQRISNSSAAINQLTLKELKNIQLHNGETIATLDDALTLLGTTPAIVEAKQTDCATELLQAIDRHQNANITIACLPALAEQLQHLRPDLTLLLRIPPLESLRALQKMSVAGIDMHVRLLNPLTYWTARRRGLHVMVYTVNSPLLIRLLGFLYPDIAICTNHPEHFTKR